ncbi:hypothetical protein NPX13_g7188 [Xylaria arbuscula]|uniref:Rhodopsin domain-containing protein n=1 Tax=Xylaria arbuscula TaxID=114810 RepID=A0A9W8TJF6_9PEZI|nr:hypothetical protein NPX13_g7188 [Xylaria arbuscula]
MALDQLHNLPDYIQEVILNGPALAPPDGVIPNLVDRPNQNALGLAVVTICLSISTFAILLAAYAKLYGKKPFHYEDYRTCWLNSIFSQHYASKGRHPSTMDSPWTSYALLVMNLLLYTIVVLTICASCKPFARLWDPLLPGKCVATREAIDISTAVTNLASDVVILIFPQRVIWRLKIKPRKKIGIAIVFLVGIFAIISAAFRVYASVHFFHSKDKTYDVVPVALWGMAEMTCGILIYCIPVIPSVFKQWQISFKSFKAAMPWVKYPTRLHSSGGAEPIPGKESLPPDSLWSPSYNDSMVSRSSNPAKTQPKNKP